MATFSKPFPLFDGPASCAEGFEPEANCFSCHRTGPAIEVGVGAELIVTCNGCGQHTSVRALDVLEPPSDRGARPVSCAVCAAVVPVPDLPDPCFVCAACVLARRVAFAKSTRLGGVAWSDANEGLTGGDWDLDAGELETVCTHTDDVKINGRYRRWLRARVPRDALLELVFTPDIVGWQDLEWPLCCGRGMTFFAEWGAEDFIANSPDGDGLAMLRSVTPGIDQSLELDDLAEEVLSFFVFRCRTCSRVEGVPDSP